MPDPTDPLDPRPEPRRDLDREGPTGDGGGDRSGPDDLPADEAPADALAAGWGAEPGDRVVEVGPAGAAREWAVPAGAALSDGCAPARAKRPARSR